MCCQRFYEDEGIQQLVYNVVGYISDSDSKHVSGVVQISEHRTFHCSGNRF